MADGSPRGAAWAAGEAGTAPPGRAMAPAIPPLRVTSLVVTTADRAAALRIYVPQLVEITPLDGVRFRLRLADAAPGERVADE